MAFIVIIVGIACGLGVVLANRALLEQWFRSRSWKVTTARIVEDRDEEVWVYKSAYPARQARMERVHAKSYFYRYEVGGRAYCSNRLGFGDEFIAQKHFRIGEKVNVYYDPDDPQNAVLVRNFPGSVSIGLIMVGTALGLLLRAIMT